MQLCSRTDPVVIINRASSILKVNSRDEKMLLYSRDELVGKPAEMLAPRVQRWPRETDLKPPFLNFKPWWRPMGIELEMYERRKNGDKFSEDHVRRDGGGKE